VVADLCILDGAWSSLPAAAVRATLIGGELVYGQLGGT